MNSDDSHNVSGEGNDLSYPNKVISCVKNITHLTPTDNFQQATEEGLSYNILASTSSGSGQCTSFGEHMSTLLNEQNDSCASVNMIEGESCTNDNFQDFVSSSSTISVERQEVQDDSDEFDDNFHLGHDSPGSWINAAPIQPLLPLSPPLPAPPSVPAADDFIEADIPSTSLPLNIPPPAIVPVSFNCPPSSSSVEDNHRSSPSSPVYVIQLNFPHSQPESQSSSNSTSSEPEVDVDVDESSDPSSVAEEEDFYAAHSRLHHETSASTQHQEAEELMEDRSDMETSPQDCGDTVMQVVERLVAAENPFHFNSENPLLSSFLEPQLCDEVLACDQQTPTSSATSDFCARTPCGASSLSTNVLLDTAWSLMDSHLASGVLALIEVLRALNLSQRCTVEELTSSLLLQRAPQPPSWSSDSLVYLNAEHQQSLPLSNPNPHPPQQQQIHKIPAFLWDRSRQGITAEDLVARVDAEDSALARLLDVRFFCAQPQRDFSQLREGQGLLAWLQHWLEQGAVPLAFVNTQCGVPPHYPVPENAWRHLLVTEVKGDDVVISEPRQLLPRHVLQQQLSSDSSVLVRKSAVTSRWSADTDLSVLDVLDPEDSRWESMNVLGQVVCCLREMKAENSVGMRPEWLHHITVPCKHKPGIALFVPRTNVQLCAALHEEAEFPLRCILSAARHL